MNSELEPELDRYLRLVCESEENMEIAHRLNKEFTKEIKEIFDSCSEISENCRIVNCDVFWLRLKELEKRLAIS